MRTLLRSARPLLSSTPSRRFASTSKILPITLPKLSPTFTHGKLLNLYIQQNQYITPSDLLYEVESDTLTESKQRQVIQVEGHEDGHITKVHKTVNDTVRVGDVIAELQLDDDEDATGKQFVYQAYVKPDE